MRTWQILLALALIASSAVGLLVMAGGARDLLSPPLQAELNVQDFPIPSGMSVDADKVASYLARALQERADDDVATRMLLKPDVLARVKDVVLPRLMNVVAVHRMLEDIPELSALVGLESFKRTVTGCSTAMHAQCMSRRVPHVRFERQVGAKNVVVAGAIAQQFELARGLAVGARDEPLAKLAHV